MTKHEFEAAWLPHDPARTFDEAAELAIEWAEAQAARRGLPTVLVTDEKGAYAGNRLFDRFAKGRHASPRSPRVDVQPGAVVTHVPTPKALEVGIRLGRGNALVVTEHPQPWRLAGWAAMVGAHDLITDDVQSLDPRLVELITELAWHGNNGYGDKPGRRDALRVLDTMRKEGVFDRDFVLSALGATDVSTNGQAAVAALIDR